jgi:O-antigen/teichoic acid export membrane protein
MKLPAELWGSVRQSPGKILTLVGPILLYRSVSLADYALFEVLFSTASMVAIILGMGFSFSLPYDLLESRGLGIPSLMRATFNISLTISVAVIGVAAVVRVSANGDTQWIIGLALLMTLKSSALGQSFLSSYYKTRLRVALGAFVEHSGWFAVACATIAIGFSKVAAPLLVILGFCSVNLLILAILINSTFPRLVPSQARIKSLGRFITHSCLPLMISQLSRVAAIASGRVVFLLAGHELASAYAALSFRLAAPVTFVYQVTYAASLRRIFAQRDRNLELNRLVSIILLAPGFLLLAIAVLKKIAFPTIFPPTPSFTIALYFSTQIAATLACGEVISIAQVGLDDGWPRARRVFSSVATALVLLSLLALLLVDDELLLMYGLCVSWLLYTASFLRTVSRQMGRLAVLVAVRRIAFASTLGAISLYFSSFV